MYEALQVLLRGEVHQHYAPWLWMLNNGLTGISYVVISVYIFRGWRIRWNFAGMFAIFLITCGIHHLIHALQGLELAHWSLPVFQIVVDCITTTVSVMTAILVCEDQQKQRAERR